MKNKFLPKKADIALILILITAALVLFLLPGNSSVKRYEISVDGNIIYSGTLSEMTKEEILTLGNGIEISVSKDGIGFINSPCHGKDCIKAGLLNRPGERAACLPNKTVISIKNMKSSGTDAITY